MRKCLLLENKDWRIWSWVSCSGRFSHRLSLTSAERWWHSWHDGKPDGGERTEGEEECFQKSMTRSSGMPMFKKNPHERESKRKKSIKEKKKNTLQLWGAEKTSGVPEFLGMKAWNDVVVCNLPNDHGQKPVLTSGCRAARLTPLTWETLSVGFRAKSFHSRAWQAFLSFPSSDRWKEALDLQSTNYWMNRLFS